MAKKRVRHHVNPLSDLTEHSFAGFDNANPIIMDIGADRGEFIEKLLLKYDNTRNFIVCEIRKPLAERLQKKFENHDNVIVFDGDIVRNFSQIIKPSVDKGIIIEEIFTNFPDPWFKAKHKKRRVINEKFLSEIKEWMPSETKWIFQTDQNALFDETVEILHNVEGIRIDYFVEPPHGATTKWEDAKVIAGFTINRLIFHY